MSTVRKMLSVGLLPSRLKIRYYRARGAKIGHGVTIGHFSTIDAFRMTIGDHCRIGAMVIVRAKEFSMGAYSQIRNSTSIVAPRVSIGRETVIMNDVVIGGLESWDSKFSIGDRCTVFPHSFINPTKDVMIGNDVGVGGSNYLFTHGSWSNALEGFPYSFGPITIEDRVWLPWRVFILPNVTIGHDSVIGAGSVVSTSIPPMSLAAGVPAIVKKSGDAFRTKPTPRQKSDMLSSWFLEFPSFLRIEQLKVMRHDETSSKKGVLWSGTIVNRKGKLLGHVMVAAKVETEFLKLVKGPVYFFSLESISEDNRREIERTGGAWFDGSAYEWKGRRDNVATELRTFFARFGVRFKSLDLERMG